METSELVENPVALLVHLATFQFLLQAAGHTDLVHLDGGMNAWRAAGLPVVKP